MKIGITGATGQLGQVVISLLKEKGFGQNTIALARSKEKAAALAVESREFDYSQPEGLVAALEGIEKLLLISSNEIGKRAQQHAEVIKAAQAAGIKHIVYTSLLRADSSSLVLAAEHLETENLIKASGISYTLLRNGWYTENYTQSLGGVLAHNVVLASAGDGKTSSATRADYALAAVVVLTTEGHQNKTYELAGDEAYTFSEYAAAISKVTGKNIGYKNIPVVEYAAVLVNAGLPKGIADFLAGTHVATEKGDLFDDSHQLSKLIGRPTTPLADAISAALPR